MRYMFTFLSGLAMLCCLSSNSYGQTDTIPPIVTDFQIELTENTQNDSVTAVFTVTYSEPIQLVDTFTILTRQNTNEVWGDFMTYGDQEVEVDGNVLTISPQSSFFTTTRYELVIAAHSVQDLTGNPAESVTRVFVADEGGPVVVDQSIELDFTQGNDSVSAVFTITYDEPVQLGPDYSVSTRVSNNGVWEVYENYDETEVTILGNVVTITPTRMFSATQRYELVLTFGSVVDLTGNMGTSFTRIFIADVEPPEVTTFDVEFTDSAFEDSISARITVTYNEDVQLSNTHIISTRVRGADGWVPYAEISDTSLVLSGNVLTIEPPSLFSRTGTYELVIAGQSIRDLAGNPAPAHTQIFLRDTIQPLLTEISPDLTQPVALNAPFVFTFDEAVRLAENFGFYTYYWDSATSLFVEFERLEASQADVEGNVVTFQPTLPFTAGTRAQIILTANSVLDFEGNSFLNVTGDDTTTFVSERFWTTERDSIVVSFFPADGDTLHVIPDTLTIAFSETVAPADTAAADTATIESLVYLQQNGLELEHGASYDSTTQVISIVPATALSFGNSYTFGFMAGLSDAIGDSIPARESVFTLTDTIPAEQDVAIAELYGDTILSPYLDEVVRITGTITGAANMEGFYIQDNNLARSAIWVQHTDSTGHEVGDAVSATGLVQESDETIVLVAQEVAPAVAPVVIEPAEVTPGIDSLALFNGLLVQVLNLRASEADMDGNWTLYTENDADSVVIGSRFFGYAPVAGNSYDVSGIVVMQDGMYRIHPRLETDIEDVTQTSTEIPTAIQLKVYPNPFSDYVRLSNHDQVSRVVITNIMGQRVLDISYPGAEIRTANLPDGVYIINLYKDNNVIKSSRIIKQ